MKEKPNWEEMLKIKTLYFKNGFDRGVLEEVNEVILKKDVNEIIERAIEEERNKFINELKTLINKRELAEIDNSIYYKKEYETNENCIDELENLVKKLKGEI